MAKNCWHPRKKSKKDKRNVYLSDRDIKWAIQRGDLIVDPPPAKIDPSSFDVHLGPIDQAKIWDTKKFAERQKMHGSEPYVRIANYDYKKFAPEYAVAPPKDPPADNDFDVFQSGNAIIVRT